MCGPLVAAALFGVFILGLYLGRKWERLSQLECQQQEIVFRTPHTYVEEEGREADYLKNYLDLIVKGRKDITVFLTRFGTKVHLFPPMFWVELCQIGEDGAGPYLQALLKEEAFGAAKD